MEWMERFRRRGVSCVYGENHGTQGGCGVGKNGAVAQSHGRILCFQDADDVMYPERIQKEYDVLVQHPNALVGTRFECACSSILMA